MVVEKCAERSEDRLSHIKAVFTRRRVPVYEQGPDANTNGSDEKHRESHLTTRQAHGLPAQAGTKIITNKPTSKMNKYLLLVTSSAGTRFPWFGEIDLPRGPL